VLISPPVKVFATRGSEKLAEDICTALRSRLPTSVQPGGSLTLARHDVTEFSNGNILVRVENVRDHFIVVIHTQAPPVNEGLIELFALLDAIRNARPYDILLVFPYMPYARSDHKNQPHISTMGYLIPRILSETLKIERVILLDPHDVHIKHYFDPVADELSAMYLLAYHLNREFLTSRSKANMAVVFSDAGAVKRYGRVAHILHLPEAYIAKERTDDTENPEFKRVIGEVGGKDCILFDDEILTGSTAMGDADLLLAEGANSVCMLAVHAVLADKKIPIPDLIQKLEGSRINQFIVTDSIPVRYKLRESTKFTILSIAGLLAEAINRTILGESLTELHDPTKVSLYC
jgi:ribose-phosphate pyrophosphokinase